MKRYHVDLDTPADAHRFHHYLMDAQKGYVDQMGSRVFCKCKKELLVKALDSLELIGIIAED
jgi:hypothetical protein